MSLYLKFLKCYYKTCLTPSLPGVETSNWKYILQAQGRLWNEECYSQRKSCPLPPQTGPERSLTEKRTETEDRRAENRWTKGGEDNNSSYLKLSSLSSSSPSVSWVTPSESSQNTLSSPKELFSLSVSILFVLWDPHSIGHDAARCAGGLALLMHTQDLGCHSTGSWWCWFRYSWDYRQETPGTHSLHMTGHLSYLRPSHCLRLHDLHNKTRAIIRVIFH